MTNEWDGEEARYGDDCERLPSALEAIVGEAVSASSVQGDCLVLALQSGGSWVLVPQGVCCSRSYWQESEFEGLENLTGSPVLRVVNRHESTDIEDELDFEGEICGEKCVKIYALELVTAKGSAVFEMRNESNGYYGGTYVAQWVAL